MADPRTLRTTKHIVDRYAAVADILPGSDLPWLVGRRQAGIERFRDAGLPTRKIEEWKYTNLEELRRVAFEPAKPVVNGISTGTLPTLVGAEHRLVFVNGHLRPDLCAICMPPDGATITSLGKALESIPALVEAHLGVARGDEDAPFTALNDAFLTDGLFLHLKPGVDLGSVIEVIHVSVGQSGPVFQHPRNLIVAEAGSHATVLEHYIGFGQSPTLANAATEVVIGEGAGVRHCKVQAEAPEAFHIAMLDAHLAKNAAFDSFYFASGAKLSRNEIRVTLDGEGADCRLFGAYMMKDRQHADHTTFIDHAKPHTTSREVYKGVLDDKARAVFQGLILVRPDAQKIEGHQLNRTLLLSDGAEIDAKPELKIFADDVKCSHGATAGELDEEALFYLRARGIPEDEARGLLVEAFLREVIDGIAMAGLREPLSDRVARWMGTRPALAGGGA
ncbi:MAG: Fe-S cluster assembly protein SufD [Alphaproteobacteria bacterium]|nr:Fe-S cluster assembly protein SufD [Alphaproteobacteria bacterium]